MQLFKRLVGYPYDSPPSDPIVTKIPFGPYVSACVCQIAGDCTRADVIGWFTLVPEEQDDHDDVIERLTASENPLTRHEIEDLCNLVEQGFGPWVVAENLRTRFGIVDE
jgi:hypothetical protein